MLVPYSSGVSVVFRWMCTSPRLSARPSIFCRFVVYAYNAASLSHVHIHPSGGALMRVHAYIPPSSILCGQPICQYILALCRVQVCGQSLDRSVWSWPFLLMGRITAAVVVRPMLEMPTWLCHPPLLTLPTRGWLCCVTD